NTARCALWVVWSTTSVYAMWPLAASARAVSTARARKIEALKAVPAYVPRISTCLLRFFRIRKKRRRHVEMRGTYAGTALRASIFLALAVLTARADAANGHIAYTDVVDHTTQSAHRAVFLDRGGQFTFPAENETDSHPAWSPNGK